MVLVGHPRYEHAQKDEIGDYRRCRFSSDGRGTPLVLIHAHGRRGSGCYRLGGWNSLISGSVGCASFGGKFSTPRCLLRLSGILPHLLFCFVAAIPPAEAQQTRRVEQTGGSRHTQIAFVSPRWLPPVAHPEC